MTRLECHELALLYARLVADGDAAAGAVLTALHGQPDPVPVQDPPPHDPKPRTRSKMTPEERRQWEADRKREQRASRSSATNGATNQCDTSATFGGTKPESQKGSPDLSKREEKRKPSDFRAVVSEIGIVEKSVSSELHARDGATFSATNGGTSGATNSGGTRPALAVLRQLQDRLATTWDFHSWRSELERIATKPAAELEKVLTHLSADEWVRDNVGLCHPGHVLKHWGKYLQPPKGKRPTAEEAPPPSRYVNHAMDAEYRRVFGLTGTGGKRA